MSYQLYWGDLHSHCSISYGHGTVEQALSRARQQLDFCSITGHAFWPDMPRDRSRYAEIIDYHEQGFATLAKNWNELLRLQAAANQPGEFVVFPSFEWHSLEYGDHNVYSASDHLALEDAPDLATLRNQVQAAQAIAIPHHIGYRSGFRGINWDAFREDASPFVEVFSLHGCSVSDDAAYPMLHDMGPRDFGSTADAGWQRGLRFGIVGGTDHHAAYPGSHGDGRMGVFAENLSRAALWEAFHSRRVFAATGDKIDARLFVDDAWIGSEIRSNGRRTLRIDVQGTDALDRAELIKNGRIIARFFPDHTSPDARNHRYRMCLRWGWGPRSQTVPWSVRLELSDGTIEQCTPCFSGQAVVAPQAADSDATVGLGDLPHTVESIDDRSVCWRSVTRGNLSMRHDTTQGMSLQLRAPLNARLTLDVNNERIEHRLDELLRSARGHFLNGWLSEAMRIGPLIPIEECAVHATVGDDPESDTDVYRLQVAQRNGQWVWLTPIWVQR